MKRQVLKNYTTTNNYTDSEVISFEHGCGTPSSGEHILFWIKNTGSNPLNYKILATVDGANWEELLGETELAAGASNYHTLTEPWYAVKFQVKSKNADVHTTCDAWVAYRP